MESSREVPCWTYTLWYSKNIESLHLELIIFLYYILFIFKPFFPLFLTQYYYSIFLIESLSCIFFNFLLPFICTFPRINIVRNLYEKKFACHMCARVHIYIYIHTARSKWMCVMTTMGGKLLQYVIEPKFRHIWTLRL